MASQTHDEAQKKLPWLVNGRLTEEERRAVEDHVHTCPDCQATVRELREMRHTVQTMFAIAVRPSPWRWQRVLQRIASPETPLQNGGPLVPAHAGRWRPWMHICMGFVLGVILTGLMAIAFRNRSTTVYRTLSGPQAEQAEMRRLTLRIAFQPDATAAEIRNLLRTVHARIVDGPSATGWYTVVVQDVDARVRESLPDRLRAHRAIVHRVLVIRP